MVAVGETGFEDYPSDLVPRVPLLFVPFGPFDSWDGKMTPISNLLHAREKPLLYQGYLLCKFAAHYACRNAEIKLSLT